MFHWDEEEKIRLVSETPLVLKRRKRKRRSCLPLFLLLSAILIILAMVAGISLFLVRYRSVIPTTLPVTVKQTAWVEETIMVRFLTSTLSPTPTETLTPTNTSTPTNISTHAVSPMVSQTVSPAIVTATLQTPLIPQSTSSMLRMHYRPISSVGAVNATLLYPNADCTWMGIGGVIRDLYGNPANGVTVRVGGLPGEDQPYETLSAKLPFYGSGGYELMIARPVQKIDAILWIQLWDSSGTPVSEVIRFEPSDDCDRSLILLNWIAE